MLRNLHRGLRFCFAPPPWSLKKCLPPFTKMVKLCASFNFQLKKCLAPPSGHLEKCLTPPDNAEIGYAILIAWSLREGAKNTLREGCGFARPYF